MYHVAVHRASLRKPPTYGADRDCGGDRSTGAPQRDPGAKRPQLSCRTGQEGGSEIVGPDRSKQGGVTESKQ